MRETIFISHRRSDEQVAEMIKDFLVATGIPNSYVFCSSLPGNDVNEKIGTEVRDRLHNSVVNILILSKEYYDSAYCLNEAGVAWYQDDVIVIPIGLPEIEPNSMVGFLNSEYKLRRLDNESDIAYLYDAIHKSVSSSEVSHSIILQETKKLKHRYESHIGKRQSTSDLDNNSHRPIFDVKILEIDKQIPGTAEPLDFWGRNLDAKKPQHKNVRMQIILRNDVIIRNLKAYGRKIDSVAKYNEPYEFTVCYMESPDIHYSRLIIELSRELYPAGVNGIPKVAVIEYSLDNQNYKQIFRLNADQVYIPEKTEKVEQKDVEKVIQTKNRMKEAFLKKASEIKKFTHEELWQNPEKKFIAKNVIIMSTGCKDQKWNTDGGYGEYEIYDFCDEGLLLWGAGARAEVDYYLNKELITIAADCLLCLPFETVVAYDMEGNSSYNEPIIYAEYQIGENPFIEYYLDREKQSIINKGLIVEVRPIN